MNGPFDMGWGADVRDASGDVIAHGYGETDEIERKNAEMVCAALNATYYMAKATGAES